MPHNMLIKMSVVWCAVSSAVWTMWAWLKMRYIMKILRAAQSRHILQWDIGQISVGQEMLSQILPTYFYPNKYNYNGEIVPVMNKLLDEIPASCDPHSPHIHLICHLAQDVLYILCLSAGLYIHYKIHHCYLIPQSMMKG